MCHRSFSKTISSSLRSAPWIDLQTPQSGSTWGSAIAEGHARAPGRCLRLGAGPDPAFASDTLEIGPGEVGVAEVGLGELRAAEVGALESCEAERGVYEAGALELELCTLELLCLCAVEDRAGQIGAVHPSLPEVDVGEVRARHRAPFGGHHGEIGAFEVDLFRAYVRERRTPEARLRESCARESSAVERRAFEADAADGVVEGGVAQRRAGRVGAFE